MSTPLTPSAKSHERVTGRWTTHLDISTRRDRSVYYAKVLLGTPIPWLLSSLACLIFLSRAGSEIAAWSCALLTALYILVDRFTRSREFRFFRIGADFFLLGYVLVGVAGAVMEETPLEGLVRLSGFRWILLLYLLTYCLELFPGLNRLVFLLATFGGVSALYGVWQHFTGVDVVREAALSYAPTPGHAYFRPSGFFSTPEIFGTLIASLLPLPAAAFLLEERRELGWWKWPVLFYVLLLGLAAFWTYHPGFWMAAIMGLVVTLIMQGRNYIKLTVAFVIFLAGVILNFYTSFDQTLAAMKHADLERSALQREQINAHVRLWESNSWIGAGAEAMRIPNYDSETGNVYFQILSQTGSLGSSFYLLFILGCLLLAYRVFQEIPRSHYWHRVFVSGSLGGQIAFHVSGLYWSTLAEGHAVVFFVLMAAIVSHISEHYSRGLVTDDSSL